MLPRAGGVSSPARVGCGHPASLRPRQWELGFSSFGSSFWGWSLFPTSPDERPLKGSASWAFLVGGGPYLGAPSFARLRWKPEQPDTVCSLSAFRGFGDGVQLFLTFFSSPYLLLLAPSNLFRDGFVNFSSSPLECYFPLPSPSFWELKQQFKS